MSTLPKYNFKEKYITKQNYYYASVSSDTSSNIALDVLNTIPINNSIDIELDTIIQVEFNKPVKQETVTYNNFHVINNTGNTEYVSDDTYKINLYNLLDENTIYEYVVNNNIKSIDDYPKTNLPKTFTFKTKLYSLQYTYPILNDTIYSADVKVYNSDNVLVQNGYRNNITFDSNFLNRTIQFKIDNIGLIQDDLINTNNNYVYLHNDTTTESDNNIVSIRLNLNNKTFNSDLFKIRKIKHEENYGDTFITELGDKLENLNSVQIATSQLGDNLENLNSFQIATSQTGVDSIDVIDYLGLEMPYIESINLIIGLSYIAIFTTSLNKFEPIDTNPAIQTIEVSAIGLQNNLNVTLTTGTQFSLSKNNIDYYNNLTLDIDAFGNILTTIIYVKYLNLNENFHSDSITLTDSIETKIINISGQRKINWTPADISTALWLDANDLSTITKDGSNFVSEWRDKSGNLNHSTSSSNARPLFNNSKIIFDGVDDYMQTTALSLNCPTSLFFVAKVDTLSGDRTILNQQYDNVTKPFQHYIDSMGVFHDWRCGGGVSTISANTIFQIGEIQSAINIVDFWLNANIGTRGASSTGYPENRELYIGKAQNYGALGWLDGDVYEIILCATAIDENTRQKIEGYLAWKWDEINGNNALVSALPVGHPYKNIKP